jgi:hypothetical protein
VKKIRLINHFFPQKLSYVKRAVSGLGCTALQLAVMEKENGISGVPSGCVRLLMYEKSGKGRSIHINFSNSTVNATALMLSCNQCDLPIVS